MAKGIYFILHDNYKVPIYLQDRMCVEVTKVTPQMLENMFCNAAESSVLYRDTVNVHMESSA
jgi:hypothetical protein